jgi:hypothetical protein
VVLLEADVRRRPGELGRSAELDGTLPSRIVRMKHFALRFSIVLLTLSIGIAVALWFKHRSGPRNCSDANYFPIRVLGPGERRAEWVGKFYAAQMEFPFSCLDENVEAYRLLFIPSFKPPAAIRIWRQGDQHQIAVKQLATEGLPEFGAKDLIVNITRPITIDEWNHFQELLKKSNFWSMTSADVRERGLDGATFLLEGKRSDQYHVVDRWSPEDQNFIDACIYLMEISKLDWKR